MTTTRALKIVVWSTDESDVEFIRERSVAAVEEIVQEYERNFDGDVTVENDWIDLKVED